MRYSLQQIQAVLDGRMDDFFGSPHPASTATAKAGDARPSPSPIATASPPASPSPIAKPTSFLALVENKIKGGLPRAKAIRAVAIEHPDAHAKYLADYNAQARQAQALERKATGLERDLRESRSARAARR